jgi:signal transduction histidine kinase/CheY-like chemotaxis protein
MISPIRAEAIRTLYVQMRTSTWSAVVVSAYAAVTALPYTHWPVIAAWAAAQTGMQALRIFMITRFTQRYREDASLPLWANYYTIFQCVAGTFWGATIYLFGHLDHPITIDLTLCSMYSLGAGSVPSNAYNPKGLYAFIFCMFGPMVVRLVSAGTLEYVALGSASGLYGVAMFGMCRVQARTVEESFRIRFENRELLDRLTVQTERAEAARHRAELASLAKSQFLAAASHDLRQPLYALSLFSASLNELRLDADGRAVVGNIQDSINAMEQLFEGLLDLSKLEAGVVQPRLAPVCIDALFDRLSQYFRPLAIQRGLDLRLRSDGEWVTSDATLLEQVLGNLISNAVRCTQHGGILVAARRRGQDVQLEVWDTGIGIAAPDLQRIFEEFVQLGNAERDRRKGLGLGLSIARRSGALIGTVIRVASRPGRGSRFWINQPAVSSAALPAFALPRADPCVSAPTWNHDLPLLLIDDDRAVRTALADLLGRWGMRFETAADGNTAMALVEGGLRFGLVIADYRLPPPWNGLDLLAAIKASHGAAAPAGVLVTADFDPALMAAASRMDVPVLAKPVHRAQLRRVLGLPAQV